MTWAVEGSLRGLTESVPWGPGLYGVRGPRPELQWGPGGPCSTSERWKARSSCRLWKSRQKRVCEPRVAVPWPRDCKASRFVPELGVNIVSRAGARTLGLFCS